MPLMHGKSKKAFSKNVETEMEHGHPLKQSLAIAYATKRAAQHKAAGGFVKEEEASGYEPCPNCERGMCKEHGEGYSAGGYIAEEQETGYRPFHMPMEEHNKAAEEEDDDMVSHIMRQRMSRGGMVANEDHGEDDDELAGFHPNEFDDLSMRDDLESSYTGANSGDEIGDEAEDEDRHDMVSMIMRSRAKKDRMPIAGYGTSYGRNK